MSVLDPLGQVLDGAGWYDDDDRREAVRTSPIAGGGSGLPRGARRIPNEPDDEQGPTSAEVRAEFLRGLLLTPEQLASMPPPDPLVDDYLMRDTIAALYGRPGTGKTFIALALVFAIVTGTTWFGHEVHRGPVLYVAAEGVSGLAQRQRAWQDMCQEATLDGLSWLPMPVNLLEPDWAAGLATVVTELGCVAVVIDTLARSMVGGDENNSGDMSAIVQAADQVRRSSGATVLLVHHSPKEGNTLRGHSALEGAVDTALLIEAGGGASLTLTLAKQKDGPQVEPLVFSLVPHLASCVPMQSDCHGSNSEIVGAELNLRDLIWQSAGSDGLSTSVLLRMSGMSERTFYRAKRNLVERKIIRNVGSDRQPRWAGVDDDES